MMLEIDPVADADFLYIIKKNLSTPLPEPWKPCVTDEGETFYMNIETGDSMLDHPRDEIIKMEFMQAKMMIE